MLWNKQWNFRSEWSSTAQYNPYDVVRYNTSLYICSVTCYNKIPTIEFYWKLLLQGGVGQGSKEVLLILDTHLEMVSRTSLTSGMRVQTLGYDSVDDGGGATYRITITNEGKSWAIPLDKPDSTAPQLYAMICNKDYVTYKMFGAPLNGIDDDGPAMLKCHAYADSIYSLDITGHIKQYHCKVENHQGTIYKKNKDSINFCSDIDLSGSTILIDDINSGWFGYYVWGDADSSIYDFETPDDIKDTFLMDNFVIKQNSADQLPPNTVLKITEDPYTARDDDGYLYTVARQELIIHDANGICSSPFIDDWKNAGGEEINCQISDLVNGGYRNSQSFTKYSCSYTYIPNKHGLFVGCDVKINASADEYCSVVWVKRHNYTIRDFVFRPNTTALHNTQFKNAMIYLFGCYNARVAGLQGFNAAGQMSGSLNGSSGYMLRITNCSDVYVEDSRMQGYWGAIAMSSVKNIYFKRCHVNRLDIHDYFSNLYAEECTFYNHSIQIGYGRGVASFTNCNWYWNPIEKDSYPSSHMLVFNASYGRIFEGTCYISNGRVYTHNPPSGEFNIFKIDFSPEATSITKHFKFPEIVVKDVQIYANDPNTHLAYFKIAGTRRATTGNLAPSHIYGLSNDNTVIWQYYGRGVNWGEDVTPIAVDQVLAVVETFLDTEKKTQFYDRKYYRCTQAGTLNFSASKPTDKTGTEFTCGTAKLKYVSDVIWQSKHAYALGDICATNPSNFYPLYLFKCVTAGISNGYFPTHTSGTVLEGINDSENEPDECWWTYVAKKSTWCIDWTSNMRVTQGQKIEVEGRLYEVVKSGTLLQYPPNDTNWFGESDAGTARLKFIGQRWQPRQWYKNGSYCEAGGRIYQLSNHDGTTTGKMPVKGNPNCVDGDHIWEYVSSSSASYGGATVYWVPNTEYADGTAIKSGSNIFIAQQAITGTSQPTNTTLNAIIMDGDRRIQFIGKGDEWQASKAYAVGDIVYDRTFISQCVTAGTSASSGWGPQVDSTWDANDQNKDNTVVWKKLTKTTADGVKRVSSTKYPSGTYYISTTGETGTVARIYKSLGGLSASSTPADISGSDFKNGTLIIKYVGMQTWMANTSYNIGDQVVANSNVYRCIFDGKLTLPNKTIFENITTNITSGHVFWFDLNTNVPTKQGDRLWNIVIRDCEGISTTAEGGQTYFGHNGNPTPKYITT